MRRAVHRVLAQRLSRKTETPLDRLLLLAYAHHRDLTSQAALAAHFLVEPSAVSRMVDRLEEDGYARRVTGEDRRRVQVEVTDRGLRQLDIFSDELDALNRDLGAELSEAEIAQLQALLSKAERALETALAGDPRETDPD